MQASELDLDLVRAEQSRRSLKRFIKHFWNEIEPGSPFIDGWCLDAICEHLAALPQIGNLLINICSRTCKSTNVGVCYPAWRFLHNPSEKFFYCSYAISLAERDSVKCRQLIETPLYRKCFGDVYSLSPDQNTKRRFNTDRNGYRLVGSVGSTVTGEGGRICVADDPISADDAESEAERKRTLSWFEGTWLNRLNPDGVGRVVIQQRLHRDDVSGFILENYKNEWTHLCLPYEYRKTYASVPNKIGWQDPRTEEGQPLWPERFSPNTISELKRNAKVWLTQYQQDPKDFALGRFSPDNFVHYEQGEDCYVADGKKILKADCWRLVSADLAITLDKRGDYTAIVVADIARSGEVIILDLIHEQLGETKVVHELLKVNEMYDPSYIIAEDVGFQQLMLTQARREGLPIRGIKPASKAKEIRSVPLEAKFELRQIWFPHDLEHLHDLETELLEFPNGRRDDIVDALAYMVLEVNKRVRGTPKEEATPAEPTAEQRQKEHEERMRKAMMQGLWR